MPEDGFCALGRDSRPTPNPGFLIIFAYHFPPENAVGGLRPFRFWKYLKRRGLECQVVTAAQGAGVSPGCEEVPDPFDTERGLGKVVELGIRKLFLPGAMGLRWSCRAREAAKRILQKRGGAGGVVFSSSPPLGSHLAAWQVVSRFHLPWIADFRDPIASNSSGRYSTFVRLFDLEKRIVRRSRFVLANTDTAADRLRALYPECADKVHLIWNGFDPEDRVRPEPVATHPYTLISHVGELYLGRTATPIIESIARLISQKRLKPDHVRLRLIGPADQRCLPDSSLLENGKTEGWLDLRNEKVPKREADKITGGSDGLLLLQPQSTLQVPGKLFEYLQIGRPILAYLARESPSERILALSGVPYRCVYPDGSPSEQDRVVAEFLAMPKANDATSAWFEEHFNAEHQTATLYDLVKRCLHRS
jgi:hypothetical protein